jgi:hypothetical protein
MLHCSIGDILKPVGRRMQAFLLRCNKLIFLFLSPGVMESEAQGKPWWRQSAACPAEDVWIVRCKHGIFMATLGLPRNCGTRERHTGPVKSVQGLDGRDYGSKMPQWFAIPFFFLVFRFVSRRRCRSGCGVL